MPQTAAQIVLQSQAEERRRQQEEVARRNLYVAQETAPEQASIAQRAASVLGRTPVEVQGDASLIAEARTTEEMRRLSEHQGTINWLGNPDNAAVGHDQVSALTGIEATLRRFSTPDAMTTGGRYRTPDSLLNADDNQRGVAVARRLPGGAIEGIGRGGEGLNTAGIRLLDRIGLGDSGLANYFRSERDVFRRISGGGRNLGGTLTAQEAQRGRAAGNNVLPQTTVDTGLAGDIAGGLGQVGAQVLVAIGSGGTLTLPSLFGQGVSQMDDRVVADQQRDGRTEYSAQDDLALLGGGAVTALSEKLGLDAILGKLPKPIRDRLTSRLADIFVAGAVEGSSEVLEGVGQNALAMTLLGEDTGLLDGTVEGGTVGAAVGSLARALVLTAIPGRQHIVDQVRSDAAIADAARFNEVADMVAGNPLMERAPERLREFLSSASDGQTVYVPAEAAATFFQSNPDLNDWLDEWDIRDQYDAALASGSDIAIDAGTYLTKIAQTPAHEAWQNDLRHGLDAMSVNEAEAFQRDGEAALTESFDGAIARAEDIGTAEAPAAQVYQNLFSQMRGAGYTIDAARTQATLAAAYFARRAERSGGRFADALAAFNNANLSIRQEFPESLRSQMDKTDVLIEALRQGRKAPNQRSMFGTSLAEFISREGGMVDTGGELAAMGADQWHRTRPGTRRLVRADADPKFGSDYVAQRAVEAGYLPEGSTGDDLFTALREEVSGRPVYSSAFERDAVTEGNAQALNDLEAVLGNLGLDVNTATNAEIKAALETFANAPEAASDGAIYEQGRLNTDSEAFRAWFGDSKVVDANGDPLVVYHGTRSDFEAFDTSGGQGGVAGRGAYFSADPAVARAYADTTHEGARTVPVYLSIQNPLVIPAIKRSFRDRIRATIDKKFQRQVERAEWNEAGRQSAYVSDERIAELEAQGYDGIVNEAVNEIVAFRPEQVKSVFNRGTFDPSDPRILYQSGSTLASMSREDFLGDPKITSDKNAADLKPRAYPSVASAEAEPFAVEGLTARYSEDGAAVFDGDTVVASYNRGDTLVVDPKRRRQGIAEELVYQWRTRYPAPATAKVRTRASQAIQEKVWARIQSERAQTFDQGARGQISLSETGAVISLFQSRDLSTFFHEFGHLTLDLLAKDAALSPEAQADLDAALKYLGVSSVEEIGVEQHELWARSFEGYLLEGKAPSLELKSVFRTVKAWMVSIYRTIRRLNAPITDDVRDIFDRLLASEDQIADASASLSLDAELSDLERETMTEAQQAEYGRLFTRAKSDAESSMLERMMRTIRRERTAEWKVEAEEIRPDVALDIDDQPDIRAMSWMAETKTSMNRDEVTRLLGDEAGLALLPRGFNAIVTKGGIHPDAVAEAAGYSSGQELLTGLMEMADERRQMKAAGDNRTVRAARIDREVQARLRERHGDALSDGSIEAEAMAALHGERMDRAVASRWSVIARSAALPPPPPLSALRAWAAEKIGGRTVRDAKPGKYLRAERKAAGEAQKALKAGNKVEAARHLQGQTINRLLYAEARKAEEFADASIRRLARLDKARTRASMDQDYLDQIHNLLEQYDLRRASGPQVQRRKNLAEFVAEQEALGKEIMIPPALVEASRKTHYSDLTVDELRAVDATVQALAKLGRLKKQLTVNGERRALNDIAKQAVASADHLPTIHREEGFRKGDSTAAKMMDWGVSFEASLVKAQEWFRLLDGGNPAGIFATVLDRPANDAFVKLQELEAEFFEPVIEAERAIPKAVRARWLDVVDDHPFLNPETSDRLTGVHRRDLIAAALNVGNMSNFEIVAKGWGVVAKDADPVAMAAARDQFVAWLDSHLDPTEWAYVQAWWDGFERNQKAYFATARELNGYAPEPVEAAPLNTSAGRLAGGYVPVSYDARFDRLQQERDKADGADMFGGLSRTSPRPDNGSTKERSGYFGPAALDLDRIAEGARRHNRYIAYGEFIDNSLKFLRHPEITRTIRDKLGVNVPRSMENWLASQVKTDAVLDPNASPFLKAARWSRTNMTAALLLGSVNVLMAQPAGLAVSASTLGVGRLAGGMMKAASLMATGQFNAFVFGKSAIMKDRFEGAGLDRDIRLALTRKGGKRSKREMASYLAGRAIAAVDVFVVSGPTWIAAYDKAVAEGREESEAVYIADKAAEMAQGSGRASTLSAIQRDNEVTKMVTFAYGWANALYGVQRGAVVDIQNGVDRTHAIYQLAAVMLLPAIADALISGDWPDWEDEEGRFMAGAKWFARNTFFGAFAGIPIIRDFAGAAERKAAGKYAGPVGQTPLGRIGDEVGKLGQDAWDLASMALGDDGAEVSRRWPAHFINSLGFVLGLPGATQAARTTNYVTDVIDGEQNPDGLLDWIAGLTKGPQPDQE